MRWFLVVALLVSLGFNVGLAWRLANDDQNAAPHRRGGGEHSGRAMRDSSAWSHRLDLRFHRLARALDLDAEQCAAFRELHRDGARGMHRRFRDVDVVRRRLAGLMSAGAVDPDSVRAAMTELSRRQAVVDSLAADNLLRELEILTAEQRREYLRLLPLDRLGGRGRRGHGAGDGPDGHRPRHGRPGGG